jgi:hypothetical protein
MIRMILIKKDKIVQDEGAYVNCSFGIKFIDNPIELLYELCLADA